MMDAVDLSLVPYSRQMMTSKAEIRSSEAEPLTAKPVEPRNWRFAVEPGLPEPVEEKVRYGECRRNHAARLGGNANDGCLEFMPCINTNTNGNGNGKGVSLTCAACGCHRNFHRKVVSGNSGYDPYAIVRRVAPASPLSSLSLPGGGFRGVDGSRSEDRRSETPEDRRTGNMMMDVKTNNNNNNNNNNNCSGSSSGGANKRFRTKFSGEQKEKMMEYADKVGWRIQRNDDVEMREFCNEIGVKRHVLKVWMHNNKNTLRGKVGVVSPTPLTAPPEGQPPSPPATVPSSSIGLGSSQVACDIREIF
ncbi:hypothetical protein GIB67_026245 [Kingdonia uniflora]|uniref:ZF-HD dimerization-type domain-containing protein n=1 Tax=Kingdonia uniflora TaxID=39325 RepID=A0A7J7L9X1_9MAGN|nr:hypothetical protein GIB67_026245 [Kingdonia uniflora]